MKQPVFESQRPIKLTIAALGGQGGGVLADWLVQIAEREGHLVQSTSVPGVAQRTGATIYYLEFFPQAVAERAMREPILALMPTPGDVDCVVASELVEAARAIQRGLVTRDRTTLIASSHRSYTITEKSAMANGKSDESDLQELVRASAKRLLMFDMNAIAERHSSVISSALLGALCGSATLPFRRQTFEEVITAAGVAVDANLAAFRDACSLAERSGTTSVDARARVSAPLPNVPQQSRSPQLQPLLDRIHAFNASLQPLIYEGARRLLDYQDSGYVELYLMRLRKIAEIDGRCATGSAPLLTEEAAKSLALWMTFEDTIRVADLKTRATRFARVKDEIRAGSDQLFGITEFMKPRVAEIAGTLPLTVGRWIVSSPKLSRALARVTGGRQIRTTTICGFLVLHCLAGLRRWRRRTLRYHEENTRIEHWLSMIERLAPLNYLLSVELARAQRLIKGYGETHERGWRNFTAVVDRLDQLSTRPDGALVLARLQQAALADEEGRALASELAALPIQTGHPGPGGAARA